MDPLALLSNLHGDGPATLHRLRRHGCETLVHVRAFNAEELAGVLGWEAARAERFLREAQSLAGRLGEGLLDPEEEHEVPRPRGEPERAPPASGSPAAAEETPELEDEEVPEELCAEVLERWRELDAREPGERTAAARAPDEREADNRDLLVPRPPPAHEPARRGLVESAIDGLDPARVKALLAAGISSVEELAACDDFDLHRRTGFPFTLASRLVFLARRAAQVSPGSVGGKGARLDASGPFA